MGQRLTLAVQGKMDVVKINGYDDDDDDDDVPGIAMLLDTRNSYIFFSLN